MCQPDSLRKDAGVPRAPRLANGCPFAMQMINSSTWLIREYDDYGEFPHIYVKLHTVVRPDGSEASILILTDTGVGTEQLNPGRSPEPEVWTIATFLEHHLNPGNQIPYLIITTHCHYDHILGLRHLEPQQSTPDGTLNRAQATVVASSHNRHFVCAERINLHSLCEDVGLDVPDWKIRIWAEDNARITCTLSDGLQSELDAIMLHAPGHTPDSLCWYDIKERTLYVGDHVYEKSSHFSRSVGRSAEAGAPILFPMEGDVAEWWRTTDKLIAFVQHENSQPDQPRVKMAAGHITADADALDVLKESKSFVGRVLAGHVESTYYDTMRGVVRYIWQEPMTDFFDRASEGFVFAAPLMLCEEANKIIPYGDEKVPAPQDPAILPTEITASTHTPQRTASWEKDSMTGYILGALSEAIVRCRNLWHVLDTDTHVQ